MSKHVLCLWSGGIDSTYMVWKYLKRGYDVDCCYIQLHNNQLKVQHELNAINKIYKQLKYIGNIKKYINVFNIDIDFCGDVILKQFPIWLNCLINSIHDFHNKVSIGYIMNDDAISYLEDFKKIYYSYQPLFWNKIPELDFPLYKIKKQEIFKDLPIELSKDTVFCENPQLDINGNLIPCCNCNTCIKRTFYEKQNWFPQELIIFNKKTLEEGKVYESK